MKDTLRLRMGAIIALIITNVLLALLWVAILLSGTVTDVMSDYIKKRYLYVPPVLAGGVLIVRC